MPYSQKVPIQNLTRLVMFPWLLSAPLSPGFLLPKWADLYKGNSPATVQRQNDNVSQLLHHLDQGLKEP